MKVRLLIIQGRPAGKEVLLGVGEHYFGRGPECQVRFNSDWVSRQHCVLSVSPEAIVLRDLGSRNGTLVNGALVAVERTLQPGDQLQVGPITFELRLEEQPETAGSEISSTVDGVDPGSNAATKQYPPET